ncbi:5144_t:CDS:2 [Diversispora eburnea]|uniref:5144_t:CDS:1 n=1 Tax=Diversispora eburnea TaxID=1213867 RepID=A0A9N9BI63_9GLOM|nr:5144_t:CDS:2 [Diversispora eburnea]
MNALLQDLMKLFLIEQVPSFDPYAHPLKYLWNKKWLDEEECFHSKIKKKNSHGIATKVFFLKPRYVDQWLLTLFNELLLVKAKSISIRQHHSACAWEKKETSSSQ